MIAKCNCQECGQPIEFEAEDSGRESDCPLCGRVTILQLPKAALSTHPPRRRGWWVGPVAKWGGFAIAIALAFCVLIALMLYVPAAVPMTVILVGGLAVYFIPSMIGRNKRNATAICMLNLFLGWTFLGWVVALVWAFTKDPNEK